MRGYNKKRAGRLIPGSLWNRSKAHVSSIESIEVHESYDSDIEKFLAIEDPNHSKPDLSLAFDYVNNLPPCLKHNKDFQGIKFGQNPTVDSSSVLTHNHALPQPFAPAVNCEVCLHSIGLYYTKIIVLQEKINALTAQNRSLIIENRELKINAQSQGKLLKRIGNIIIENVDSLEAIINSEILWFEFGFQLNGKIFYSFICAFIVIFLINIEWFRFMLSIIILAIEPRDSAAKSIFI